MTSATTVTPVDGELARLGEAVRSLSTSVTSGLDLVDALDQVLGAALSVLDADAAWVCLAEITMVHGARRVMFRKGAPPRWVDLTDVRDGLSRKVLQTGQPVALENVVADLGAGDSGRRAFRSVIVVPVRRGDRPVAALSVGWSGDRPRLPGDAERMALLGDVCAVALDNALLRVAELAAHRDAGQAREQLQRFLATVAHDLEGPLTLVVAYSELLRSSTRVESFDVAQRALPGMERAARRIQRLVNDLLIVSNIGAQRFDIVPLPMDLGDVLRDVIAEQQANSPVHRILLNGPPHLDGFWDPSRIREVFSNLVSNAVKFSPPGADVRVDVNETTDQIIVRVVDEGFGIPSIEIPRLFQPFSQLEAEPTTTGVGLGLYIAKVVVEKHGGTLAVTSEVGRGSVFEVCLPRRST